MILAYLAAGLAAILWGGSFLLTKITLTELGPMAVAALRWWIASAVLLALASLSIESRESLKLALRKEWPVFVGLGILGEGLYYIFQNLALVYTTTVDVGLIMNAFPALTAVLAVWLLGERFTQRALFGLLFSIAGVTLVSLGGLTEAGSTAQARLAGNLLALTATIVGAVYLILGKRVVATYGPLTVTALGGLFGALALTPFGAWEGVSLQLSAHVWGALIGLALGCGAAATWLWWYAANRMPVSRAGVFIYITPVVSTYLGVMVLQEPLGTVTAAGAIFVLGGVVLAQT
jgi:drug/metabolite transporter (DMT)-like permease